MKHRIKADQESEPHLIGALLGTVVQALYRQVNQRLIEEGFPDYRHAYLPVFQSRDGSRVTELAERAQITKQSMGELVRALEERGYVERVPDPRDGRAVLIRRTERGWALNRAARRFVQELQDEWAKELGEEEMNELLRILRRLAAIVDDSGMISGDPRPIQHKFEGEQE